MQVIVGPEQSRSWGELPPVSDLMLTRMGANSGELELIVEGIFAKASTAPILPRQR